MSSNFRETVRAGGAESGSASRALVTRAIVLGVMLAASAAGCADPADDGAAGVTPQATLAALLDSAFRSAPTVPGAILRIEAPREDVLWQAAVGVAESGTGADLRPEHTLRIASMTKTYVAAAVLRLVEEGRVELDEAVGAHLRPSTVRLLREGGYDPSKMTVSMVLRHTAGLADHATQNAFLDRVLGDPSHRWSREEQLRLAMDVSAPAGAPGQGFHYSDTGYILLGELIEVVTGEPLHAALPRLLSFERLGLNATWMEGAEPPPPGASARAHQYLDTVDTWGFDPSFDLFGGGGLVSSLRDVSAFVRALFEGGVFQDPETLPRMLAVTPASVSAIEGGYGMGIARVEYGAVECFGHGGFWGTLVRYCPEVDLLVAAAVTSTSGRSMLDGLVRRVVGLLTAEATDAPSRSVPPARGSPGFTGTDADAALVADLEGMIPERMRADQVPGLNVLILRDGEVVWQAPFGWADQAKERRMTLDALFRVESISKSVTAWGIVKLAEADILDLDAPVQSQLSRAVLGPRSPPLSPRQLLSHTAGAGLGDYTARYAPGDDAIPTLEASLRAELQTIDAPGERFSYSDTGYNLLEYLLEDRAESDFAAWMDRTVLDPLGMADAAYEWDPAFRARVPAGHTLRGRPVEPYVYPGRGSGGLVATIGDVGRFVQAGAVTAGHAEGVRADRSQERVLADSSVALLHRPVVRTVGLYGLVSEGYGLGHFTEMLSDGRSAVWHGGQGYGWMTHFHLVPETGDGIVLLANSQRAWPLFGHILRAWSASIGVEPVRMSRVTWAAPIAWVLIGLCVLGSGALLRRSIRRHPRGGAAEWARAPRRTTRILAATGGFGLLWSVAWASGQEYLFMFSILPSAASWLGFAVALLALALIAWAAGSGAFVKSRTSRTLGAAGLAAVGLALGSVPVRAQLPVAEVVVEWMPASEVTRSLAGPAAEASVRTVRGFFLLPLVLRRGVVLLAPRIAVSRVGVAPYPIDPAEPVWVEALFDLDLEILADVAMSDRTRLSAVLAPGLASDLRGTRSDHLTLQGTVLLTRGSPAGPTWGGGASFTNSLGEARVIPLLLLQWEGRGMRLDLLAPAEGRLFWALGDRASVGVQGRVDGNVYGLGRTGTLEGGRVRYSRADAGPAVQFDIGPRLRISASAGISFLRRLEVEDSRGLLVEDAALSSGGRIGFGLSWMVPEGTR